MSASGKGRTAGGLTSILTYVYHFIEPLGRFLHCESGDWRKVLRHSRKCGHRHSREGGNPGFVIPAKAGIHTPDPTKDGPPIGWVVHKLISTANNLLIGNAGNDTITGNDGCDILLGGDGNDTLKGISGRNLLIGGTGADLLQGGTDGDLLLSGSSTFETDPAILQALLVEWASGNSYQSRVDHLLGNTGGGANTMFTLNPATVTNDANADYLTGNARQDWFLASSLQDVLTDKAVDEIFTHIDAWI